MYSFCLYYFKIKSRRKGWSMMLSVVFQGEEQPTKEYFLNTLRGKNKLWSRIKGCSQSCAPTRGIIAFLQYIFLAQNNMFLKQGFFFFLETRCTMENQDKMISTHYHQKRRILLLYYLHTFTVHKYRVGKVFRWP